ncbi:MAG: VOC family protein [Gammaproteobacteria bacterium]|nr:MAG: VOC family protein [Gammaproteobacteria bacterium]
MQKQALKINAQVSWVYTHELDSTAIFYADLLGLECCRDEGGARIFKTGDGAFIGLCQAFEDRVVEPAGGMISLVTDDVDACYQRLLENGLQIDSPPRRLDQFGIYSFFVRDPNGYVIEFQSFER